MPIRSPTISVKAESNGAAGDAVHRRISVPIDLPPNLIGVARNVRQPRARTGSAIAGEAPSLKTSISMGAVTSTAGPVRRELGDPIRASLARAASDVLG